MLFNCSKLTPQQVYFLMVQTIIPRPIAWVLSDNGAGSYNLSPFSFFNAVTSEPPIIMISIGWKNDITRKDTWTNIEQRHDFVVHIPTEADAKNMEASSEDLPHGISEVEKLGLKLATVEGQRLPRVVGPKVAYFCQKFSIQEIGGSQQGLILGEVKEIWVEDSLVRKENDRLLIDPVELNPVCRLGGHGYSLLGQPFYIKRPR